MRIAIIGGGVMGQAVLTAALERQVFQQSTAVVAEVLEVRRLQIAAEYGVETTTDATAAMTGADVVVLSVKPQDLHSVRGSLAAEALLVSIMAGVRIERLQRDFHHDRIVRVMPNTPVAARAGMSVWTATEAVSEDQRAFARSLLAAVGAELYVDDESKLDMATAVSGSGPAYVYLFIEAMVEGAVNVGLPRAQAEQLVLQTVLGSALYAEESGRSATELRAMVTSPAGTTAAGILELERGAVRASIIECIRAAFRRSVELGSER